MNRQSPNLAKMHKRLMQASSVAALMGWAALGQEYANSYGKDAPSGFDYTNAAELICDLLTDTCGDIELLQREKQEVVA